jgi:hypothetical protein
MNNLNNLRGPIGYTGPVGVSGVAGYSGPLLYVNTTEGINVGDTILCETVDSTISKLLGQEQETPDITLEVTGVYSTYISLKTDLNYQEICKFYCNGNVYYIKTNETCSTSGTSGGSSVVSGVSGRPGIIGYSEKINLIKQLSNKDDNSKNTIFDIEYLLKKFNIKV